jgi:hypothetical protein
MTSAYFASLVNRPVVIKEAGSYITRSGEVVQISMVSTNHNLGCKGTYSSGVSEAWHKSGRILSTSETANDIVAMA